MSQPQTGLTQTLVGVVEYIGKLADTLFATLWCQLRLKLEPRLTVFHMSGMGINSLPIVFLVVGFTGMMLSLQMTLQAVRFGTTQFIGGAVAFVMIRELAPVLTAVVLAGRVGSSMASELGAMKVTDQIDALRSLGTNPVQYLVAPRMTALMIMAPVVTILAAFAGIMASYWVAFHLGGISWPVFFKYIPRLVDASDINACIIKSLFFAVTVSVISCVEGMYTKGGAFGVGRATTNAVVVSMVSIFGLNYLLTLFLF